MNKPLVSIVCLCYNQAAFVQEAVESVWAQTYSAIELIVVDDGSSDESVAVIESLLKDRPEVPFLKLPQNIGNCKAFNKALEISKGKYVIDLAADDVLMRGRVEEGVEILEAAGEEYGVHFTDAVYIDIHGRELKSHFKRDKIGRLIERVPQGRVYADVLQRYFICTPSMMMRKSVLDALDGYDESLAYEDFDFWVRSARKWQYCFSDKVLVKKRIVPGSWSARQYEKKNRQLESTLAVCVKAKQMNKNSEEDYALSLRLGYEIRQAIRYKHFHIAAGMLSLLKDVCDQPLKIFIYRFMIISGKIIFPEKE